MNCACLTPLASLPPLPTNFTEKVAVWIHEHPRTVRITEFFCWMIGLCAVVTSPAAGAYMGGTVVTLCTAVLGSVFALAGLIGIMVLDLLIPPHHEMRQHAFKPGECEGGKLFYEGDVPILSLTTDDPFKAGKAQGYLCGEAIYHLNKRFDFALHNYIKMPRVVNIPTTLKEIKKVIPSRYLLEMEGLAAGYNQWAKEQTGYKLKELHLDDALLYHLLPDITHFSISLFEGVEKDPVKEWAVACTALVDKDPKKGMVVARNMDWPSLGLTGTYSLILHRNNSVEVGIPGFVGTLTGMNSHGLSLAMNVCSGETRTINGMPAVLYNRACLEECKNVEDVENFISKQSPLGSYHLTAADSEQAESIHFFQSAQNNHVIRKWSENQPLTTLNSRYDPNPHSHMHHSTERQLYINDFIKQKKPLEKALKLPYVNNWETTHRVVMEPKSRRFRVVFDNAFAGKVPLHEVPTHRLFTQT